MSERDYSSFDWDITDWSYNDGRFQVGFHDGTAGHIPVSDFPVLNEVPEKVLTQAKHCPWYVALRQEGLEWEVSEAELYGRVNGRDARNRTQQKYMQQRQSRA